MATQTFTTEIPERISSHHYIIRSSKREKHYNLIFNEKLGRWICDCPDARPSTTDEKGHTVQHGNSNPNCKHRRRLLEFIHTAKAQQEATQIVEDGFSNDKRIDEITRLVQILSESQDTHILDTDNGLHALRNYCMKLNVSLENAGNLIQEQALEIALLKKQIAETTSQIEQLAQVQPVQIKTEQIVFSGKINQARGKQQEESEAKPREIQEIRNEHGRITSLQIGKFVVKVSGRCSGECNCSHGVVGRLCPHVKWGDEYLEQAELVKK